MSVLEQITLAWQCLLHAGRQMARPALWVPWLALGAAQIVVVAALWGFAHPALSRVMAPLLTRLAGDEVLHYPELFRVLPLLFARLDLVLAATLGTVVAGISTALFAARFAASAEPGSDVLRPRESAWRAGLKRAVPVVLVNLPLALLALALSAATARFGSAGLVGRVAGLGALAAAVLVQAWFLYATAFVVLEGRGVLGAFAGLPRAAARGGIAAVVLTLASLAIAFPFQQLARASGAIVDRGVPELVGAVVVAQVAAALVSAFLLTGGTTLIFQSAIAEREGD